MAAAATDAATATRDGQTALALRLAKHLAPPAPGAEDSAAAAIATNKNVAFSPVSLHAALALTAAGAHGATLAQLLAFLGAPSAEELADFGRRVADRVLADRSGAGGPRVLFGGGVWVDASRGGLTDAFRDVAAEAYKSEARTVSFTEEPEAAVKMINSWVKKATDNLIESIISTGDINADTDLVLANAVYFKGDWMEPFQPCGTSTFHLLDGRHTKAEFMSMSYYTLRQVACMDGFKVLKIPYKEAKPDGGCTKPEDEPSVWPHASKASRYSMFVFLPDTRDGMATMVDVVTASPAFMYSILAQMKLRWVNLKLPKFKITFNRGNLKETLCQLGLTLPFSPEAADLRGMCDGDEGDGKTRQQALFLSKVAHMAVVNVNEKGTEAGAVAFKLRGGGGPPDIVEFTADHPFTFFIMEERSGVIVFVGHVLDPTK
ncbi:putative serpin-Z5 [Miscanthus floridulus]|uniref:putative serpin-Z5 n=1 Tax=Miscanthus floridulus TaxID=154761 RepID=UPI0034577D9A